MNKFKSKKEQLVYQCLVENFSNDTDYTIEYESVILKGSKYQLTLDFVVKHGGSIV